MVPILMKTRVSRSRVNLSGSVPTERVLHKEVSVASPIDRVWWAWTTSKGMASWWAKDSWIDLRIGGPWELYFLPKAPRGSQGSEGCRILSYLPPEMLSFSWNFPPQIPELRSQYIWVVLRLTSQGPSETRVTVDHLGWQKGPVWEQGYRYFDDAWSAVLERLSTHLPRTRRRMMRG
jgi:uncharacterized protein YndB with AHSA1/START domain